MEPTPQTYAQLGRDRRFFTGLAKKAQASHQFEPDLDLDESRHLAILASFATLRATSTLETQSQLLLTSAQDLFHS